MVKVNDKEVKFREGMTVAEALKVAGESLDQMTIIMVDGQVISKGNVNSITITVNTNISLLPLTSGG